MFIRYISKCSISTCKAINLFIWYSFSILQRYIICIVLSSVLTFFICFFMSGLIWQLFLFARSAGNSCQFAIIGQEYMPERFFGFFYLLLIFFGYRMLFLCVYFLDFLDFFMIYDCKKNPQMMHLGIFFCFNEII